MKKDIDKKWLPGIDESYSYNCIVYSCLHLSHCSPLLWSSWKRVSSIDNKVAPSRISRSITGEVEIQALDLFGMTLATKRGHSVRLVDCKRAGTHFGVEEPWRDDVHASKLSPLTGQRLSKVSDKGFASVINRLVGGNINHMSTHAGRYDQVSAALALEDLARILCAEDDTVD